MQRSLLLWETLLGLLSAIQSIILQILSLIKRICATKASKLAFIFMNAFENQTPPRKFAIWQILKTQKGLTATLTSQQKWLIRHWSCAYLVPGSLIGILLCLPSKLPAPCLYPFLPGWGSSPRWSDGPDAAWEKAGPRRATLVHDHRVHPAKW